MTHGGDGGQKKAKNCHVLFEWPHILFLALKNEDDLRTKLLFEDLVGLDSIRDRFYQVSISSTSYPRNFFMKVFFWQLFLVTFWFRRKIRTKNAHV